MGLEFSMDIYTFLGIGKMKPLFKSLGRTPQESIIQKWIEYESRSGRSTLLQLNTSFEVTVKSRTQHVGF
jgi:hypothetical protein